jgi:hypothetical protein
VIRSLKGEKQNVGFLRLIFSSFFRWWWAATTGFASIAGFLAALTRPEEGILLPPLVSGALALFGSALLFLTISTVYQSWLIYQKHFTRLQVVGFSRHGDNYPDSFFILESHISYAPGTLIELQKFHGGLDVTIALVELMKQNSRGQYPARPIWISPGHRRDLRIGQFVYSEIKAEPLVQWETIQRVVDQIA